MNLSYTKGTPSFLQDGTIKLTVEFPPGTTADQVLPFMGKGEGRSLTTEPVEDMTQAEQVTIARRGIEAILAIIAPPQQEVAPIEEQSDIGIT